MGEKDILELLKLLDANNDTIVSRSEIRDMFVMHRGRLVKYFGP